MQNARPGGYTGQILRVDLTSGKLSKTDVDKVSRRQYIGGTGLGIKILYDEVPPEVQWNDPRNRLIFASGPLNGTRVMGSGVTSVVTKGAMTGGATSTQAAGFMGAYLKFSGFDAVVLEGASDQWVYLYLHDGVAELRDASHLVGKNIVETEELIKKELGHTHGLSIFSIGPAGENMVRFAAIVGDQSHVAGHNGAGAVMGSKKLKAIVAVREPAKKIVVSDPERLSRLVKEVFESVKAHKLYARFYESGTSCIIEGYANMGLLSVKNYTTNEIPQDIDKFMGTYYREHFHTKPNPCWACRMNHCHTLEVTEGPYSGYVGEEPEYEQWAAWGPQIGGTDPGAAVVLSNETDHLGLETNEASWVMGLVIECFEKGILTRKDTDGLDMTWGNTEAVRAMLRKIAYREGIGDILAEGVKRTVEKIGGELPNMGIYTLKGSTPRAHDDRANWLWMLDHCTSNTGVTESLIGANLSHQNYVVKGTWNSLAYGIDPLDPVAVPKLIADRKGIVQFEDSLVVCLFTGGPFLEPIVEMVNAVTGWDMTTEEALDTGLRIANLLKAFNVRHGLGPELDAPSPRYSSAQVDGPLKSKSVAPFWPQMLRSYYEQMGWDGKSGKPLPETLRKLGLEHVVGDLWDSAQT